ncbi:MAG: YdeI/OmpD-associated family protein [Bacteroidota bacterium]
MIKFTVTILKFDSQGEKTGWTYIPVSFELAQQLNPANKKSFRVKGKLDSYSFKQVALIPIGEGNFIMPLNAAMRKAIGKRKGAEVAVQMVVDEAAFQFSEDMVACLEDEPKAKEGFEKLSGSEQKYFSKWIESAKTDSTKAKRIAQMMNAMLRGLKYGEMIRSLKSNKIVE